jgi:hypothetical protein
LRVWKAKLSRRIAALDRVLQDPTVARANADFLQKGEKGCRRAFDKLHRRLSRYAVLEGVRTTHNPIAVWAMLKPREAVVIEPDHPSDAQDCVVVDYMLTRQSEWGTTIAMGLWTLEVPDHALGRGFMRAPGQDMEAAMLEAHHTTLRIRVARMKPHFADPSARFFLPAGPGVFVCSAHIRSDVSMDGGLQACIRAHTWLHRDQLSDNREAEIFMVDDIAGERLGEGYLLPMPLRVIEAMNVGRLTDTARVAVWVPGMPDTIAQPIGTA